MEHRRNTNAIELRQALWARLATFLTLAAVAGFSLAAQAQPAGIDPQAHELLKASTDFLASQNQFSAETRNSLEVVLTSGQKIQFDHTSRAVGAAARTSCARTASATWSSRSFYFDGKSLTMLNPGEKYYATVAAPGTLEEMLDFARTKLDIVAPAGDLIYTTPTTS